MAEFKLAFPQTDLRAPRPEESFALPDFRSPKRSADGSRAKESSFPYYAGYSEAFTEDVLSFFASPGAKVLDPWNGSGTTTLIANRLGIDSVATDLNPVMCVVAQARLARSKDVFDALEILRIQADTGLGQSFPDDDPLSPWLGPKTATGVRDLIQTVMGTCHTKSSSAFLPMESIGVAKSLILVAVFLTVKKLLGLKRGSNPTWNKQPRNVRRGSFTAKALRAAIRIELESFLSLKECEYSTLGVANVSILCENSEKLPLADDSIDFVLTSPPYCTRIDYAVSTRLELAILGVPASQVDGLRRRLLGTTAIRKNLAPVHPRWGAECVEVLDFIRTHPSHGSASYYYKNTTQYFESLFRSIGEIARVLKPEACAAVVLQSSYYKERRVDLALIFTEMAEAFGLQIRFKKAYAVKVSMARLNSHSPRYRTQEIDTEELVILQKS